MADCKNQGMGYAEKKPQNNYKSNPSSVFNRSLTVNSSAAAAAAESKPLYNPYSSPAFQRNGSVKSSHGSSYGSMVSASNSFKGKVRKLCSIFESPKHPSSTSNSQSVPLSSPTSTKANKLLTASDSSNVIPKNGSSLVPDSPFRLPGTEDRVVIYFTSLRGIRRTFQDCHSVRMIFRGFRVNLDERDISMDIGYRKELQKVLGENNASLPQVFIKGKYIGGADVVKQLLEVGELAKLLKGLPLRGPMPCDACDDVRFIPCTNCNGSRKVFDEDEEQPKRCTDCNENGLVHCPLCYC
ncbi:Glutaredoxin-related protein [Handroanthus impetiginosus]|uniref:Glutaredoxin-related protein n=1 Tax=Handroanthus impetiginosus TaxID=429701 RepID=A0A2G9G066_9LAMI|nr:Glutaredoxin-related protein [Handroanthus impetiginosus]